jgi:hypothetical protein
MDSNNKKYIIAGIAILGVITLIILFSIYSKKEDYKKYMQAPSATPDMTSLAAKSNGYLSDSYTGKSAGGDHLNRFSLKNSESRPRVVKSSKIEAYAAPAYDLVHTY